MKAPDVIYINNYNGDDTWGSQWHTKPSSHPATISHEYIRKNALLDWLKAVKADPMIPMNIDRVIEKIKSL